jgi:hypothetical protein
MDSLFSPSSSSLLLSIFPFACLFVCFTILLIFLDLFCLFVFLHLHL